MIKRFEIPGTDSVGVLKSDLDILEANLAYVDEWMAEWRAVEAEAKALRERVAELIERLVPAERDVKELEAKLAEAETVISDWRNHYAPAAEAKLAEAERIIEQHGQTRQARAIAILHERAVGAEAKLAESERERRALKADLERQTGFRAESDARCGAAEADAKVLREALEEFGVCQSCGWALSLPGHGCRRCEKVRAALAAGKEEPVPGETSEYCACGKYKFSKHENGRREMEDSGWHRRTGCPPPRK